MRKIITLFAALAIAACSATSQDARISVFPDVAPSSVGSGSKLSITVDDGRQSAVIGTYRDGAQITTSQDLAKTIGEALVDSFEKQGFNVVAAGDPSAMNIFVALQDLTFTYDGNVVSSSATTTSRVRVDVINNSFNRTYTNSLERTIPFAANQDTNNSQLSATLRAMVEKIVNDPELIDTLKR